jgi:tetratricopeptide (TPR) repeat protein
MIEQALVYIYSMNPARRFVGCGALVEGGYVATCRHVWRMATGAAKAEANGPLRVEVEYPRAREDGGVVRRPARLADACESATDPPPDLVLLLPDEIPVAGVTILRLASHERFQAGPGYAIAGLIRDEKKPNTPRDARIPGTIADHEDADGRREFTGDNPNAFWFQPGSSGSPVFVDGGEQLAGIVSLSELGANESKSRLHKAFVVPGTTIRTHVVRLKAAPVARDQHIPIADLRPVLDQLGAQNVPVAEIPARIADFVTAARAHAAERVPASNDGADIDAAIAASRRRLQVPDAAGARAVLQAKIDEEREARARRLVPLLKERATVDRLAFDYESARSALSEITALTTDDVWAWLDLGDLWKITGPLDCALRAYREAEGAARRTNDERDLSVSYDRIGNVLEAQGNLPKALKSFRDGLAIAERLAQSDPGNAGWQSDLSVSFERVGDVLKAQGNLPEALKSFRDGLAIRERLAQSDPGNAGWQFDLVVSHWSLAVNGDDAPRRFAFIVDTLRRLKAENRLTPEQERWLPEAEAQLAKVRRGSLRTEYLIDPMSLRSIRATD